ISLLVPAWLLSSSAPAEAQSATQIFRPGLVSMPACSSTFDAPPMMESQLLACIKQLAIDVGAAADPDTKTVQFRSPAIPDGTSAAEAAALEHKALLQEYAGYIIWRRQVEHLSSDARTQARATLAQVGDRLHEKLREHDLEESAPLTGELRAGSALTDTGVFTGVASSHSESGAEPLAHIAWTTTHAGALDRVSGGDVAVSGLVGLQPAMTVVKVASGASLDAAYQQALVVAAGLNLNGFSGRTETSAVVRAGFVRLGELAQVVEHDGASELALPAGSQSKVAPYFEAGARFSLFDRPMALIHLTHTELAPRLMAETVYRPAARFDDLPGVGP